MSMEIQLTQGYTAIIDDADYELVNRWKWTAHVNKITGRVCAFRQTTVPKTERAGKQKQKQVFMHRFLMNAPADLEVDHINGIALDNRRANLRLATSSQNKRNRRSFNKRGYKGISRSTDGRWKASINLGTFNTPEEAARAYDEAASKLFGEFAKKNFDQSA